MYQPDINTYLDAIKQQYDVLLQENKKLKIENKKLIESNLDFKRKINFYKNIHKPTNLIKLGSDWSVEGHKHFDFSQIKKFYFKDLYFSSICKNGNIIFLSQNILHVLIDNSVFLLVNDTFVEYDDNIKKFKYSFDNPYIRYFLDDEDFLYIFSNNFLKKYDVTNRSLISTINMPNHIGIVVKNNIIYLTCYDKSFRMYNGDKLILLLNSPEEIKSNLLIFNNIGYSVSTRNNLVIFDITNKTVKIINLNINEDIKRIYNIENVIFLKATSLLIFDLLNREVKELDIEEDVKFMNIIDKYILVGNSSGLMFYEYKSKTKMYIKINDGDILNMANSGRNVLVEGQNMIRVYELI
ncbi:WD40 repeat domain-containing protein [Vairimorpha necatrix]|uniref:WD40 repeat domain-containing protein n=1 Tax=Vairimorpha necatrix TaxID=6039 RepID=A0AAX4JEL6_9MICR